MPPYCTLVARISVSTQVFIQNTFSSQHGLIKDHILIEFLMKILANMSFLHGIFIDNLYLKKQLYFENPTTLLFRTTCLLILENCQPNMLIQDHTVIRAIRVNTYRIVASTNTSWLVTCLG